MHTTGDALIQAICDDPDADDLRLIYADWLDDHGDPERAEFIHAQIQLARDGTDSPERRALAYRAWQLQEHQEAQTRGTWLSLGHRPRFRRGFIEGLRLDGESLSEGCPGFENYPLRSLEIRELHDDIELLRKIPPGNAVRSLDLTGTPLDSDDLWCLEELTNLPRLERLSLQFCFLDDRDISRLCELSIFQRLGQLRLGANPFSEAGQERLREHLGDRVSFISRREDDTLYAFTSDRSFVAGHLPDHRQALLITFDDGADCVTFDFEGRLLKVERVPLPEGVRDIHWTTPAHRQFVAGWKHRVGLIEARIHVRRFRLNERVGMRDFTRGWERAASTGGREDLENTVAWIENWLERDKFAWDWRRGDWWLDRQSGEVTDT